MGQRIDRLERAFAEAREPVERIDIGAKLAASLLFAGQVAKSRTVLAEAHRAVAAITDHLNRARALCAIGAVRVEVEDFPGALEDFTGALRDVENTSDRRLEAAVLVQMGKVLSKLGEPTGAIDRLTKALGYVEQVEGAGPWDDVERDAYLILASIYARLDDPERSGRYAHRALNIAQRLNEPHSVLTALRSLGNVYAAETERLSLLGQSNTHEGEQAIAWYEKARPLAQQVGDRPEEVWLVNNTAHVLRLTGREKDAVALVEELLARGADDLLPVQLALLYFNLGDARLRLGEPEAALRPMCEALRIAKEHRALEHLPKLHLGLAEAYERLGDTVRAVEHHKAYHDAERRLRGEDIRSKALLAAVRLEKEELNQASLRLREESDALHRLLNSLKNRNDWLDDQVRRDALTGLANRLAFDEWLEHLPQAIPGPLSVALLDLDRFKSINDSFSHLIGDEVLRRVGVLLSSVVRQGDLVARYGGEEFGVVLPATTLQEAVTVCERIRLRVAGADWSAVSEGLRVTLSIGVAEESSPWQSLTVADQRLYVAKQSGRNRTVAG